MNATTSSTTSNVRITLTAIRTDRATQARAEMNSATVEDYADILRAGNVLPPVTVYKDDRDPTVYRLVDGFHRLEAHRSVGATEIECVVFVGSERDAILHAVGVNNSHGLPRSRADKRRAVEMVLRDEEWSKAADNWIADKCSVDHKTVAAVRRDLGIPKCSTVEAKDGRTIDTSKIGKRPHLQLVEAPQEESATEPPSGPEPAMVEAAKMLNVSVSSVELARTALESGSETLIREVDEGRMSVSAAAILAEPLKDYITIPVDQWKAVQAEIRRLQKHCALASAARARVRAGKELYGDRRLARKVPVATLDSVGRLVAAAARCPR